MKPVCLHQRRARFVDRLVAALGLLGSAPVLVVAAMGIKVSDPGPVIYRARRAGLEGRPFTMFKLRTMRTTRGAGQTARITGGTDTRVFPFGRLLRQAKIDELPQLVNVLLGEMAIVGPRPEDPSIVEREYEPWMRETLTVLPGLTSPGSLNFYADEAALPADPVEAETEYLRALLPRKLAVDLFYVRNRSHAYDVAIILRTVAAVFGAHSTFRSARIRENVEAERILREQVYG